MVWSRGRGWWGGPTGLPIIRKTKTSTFLTNIQSRFASVVLDCVLAPQCLAPHTWRPVVPEAIYKTPLRALQWGCNISKNLQGSQIETMDLLGRTEKKNVSLTRGQWFALLTNHWFFTCLASKILECLGLKHKSCNFVSWVRPCAAGGTLVQLSKKGVSLFYNYFQQKSLAGWGSRRQVTKHST